MIVLRIRAVFNMTCLCVWSFLLNIHKTPQELRYFMCGLYLVAIILAGIYPTKCFPYLR